MTGNLLVGTSGWSYKHWRDRFYPADLSADQWLKYYCEHFKTVEINRSFYRLTSPHVFQEWHDTAPADFIFAVKASRYLTHMKKLKDPEEPWARFWDNARSLKEKLGPILFQFPAGWSENQERLAYFLNIIPTELKCAFEFRHPSWFKQSIYNLLSKHGAALCIADSPQFPIKKELTAPFTFLRFHGGQSLYSSQYTLKELEAWAEDIGSYLSQDIQVFAYFNNDAQGYAVENAQQLTRLLDAFTS